MKNYVVSQEKAMELRDAGFPQETIYYWVKEKTNELPFLDGCSLMMKFDDIFYPIFKPKTHHDIYNIKNCDYISAPLTDELLKWLPVLVRASKITESKYNVRYAGKVFSANKPPDALSDMYCYLSKEKLL